MSLCSRVWFGTPSRTSQRSAVLREGLPTSCGRWISWLRVERNTITYSAAVCDGSCCCCSCYGDGYVRGGADDTLRGVPRLLVWTRLWDCCRRLYVGVPCGSHVLEVLEQPSRSQHAAGCSWGSDGQAALGLVVRLQVSRHECLLWVALCPLSGSCIYAVSPLPRDVKASCSGRVIWGGAVDIFVGRKESHESRLRSVIDVL